MCLTPKGWTKISPKWSKALQSNSTTYQRKSAPLMIDLTAQMTFLYSWSCSHKISAAHMSKKQNFSSLAFPSVNFPKLFTQNFTFCTWHLRMRDWPEAEKHLKHSEQTQLLEHLIALITEHQQELNALIESGEADSLGRETPVVSSTLILERKIRATCRFSIEAQATATFRSASQVFSSKKLKKMESSNCGGFTCECDIQRCLA